LPLCKGGYIDLPGMRDANGPRRVRLVRIHMEEDAGKNIHEAGLSLVDFNRSSVPLVEIVSEPDIRSAAEASAYLRELRGILRSIEASDGKMEEGGLRCDVNVSVRPKGATEYGTKTEIKNLNSFHFVEKAIEYEVARQIEKLEAGGRIAQETHLWDPVREETRPMRSKEFANDYRYFPEPDLPPLRVTGQWIEEIKTSMPELPAEKRARFVREVGLTEYEAAVLTEDREVANYFETMLAAGLKNQKTAANWPWCRRNRQRTGPGAGLRRRGDRGRVRQGAGGGAQQGRRISRGPRQALRLFRRAGDEGDGRQGQSESRQRDPQG
jgi:aspartyl-tRNA(Asn)/glutamyl-tRNA(Gln) amidotransferase subunit B